MDVPRVEDYLNDKIQTFTDFDTLDNLLVSVQSQQALLKKQLEEAESDLRDAENASLSRAAEARQKAELFEHRQADIDRRLMIITQSDSVDDAVARFEPYESQLRSLSIADKYAELLEEVEQLRGLALEHAKSSPERAVASYHQLRSLHAKLQPLQQAAEGAAPHVIDFVATVVQSVRSQLRETYAAELNIILNKILWPKKSTALPSSLLDNFKSAVGNLLVLQKPELEDLADEAMSQVGYHPLPVLLPLEVMVEPLAARFKFHFSGDRPTNRVDKPEYFLANFLDVLQTHTPFISEYLQPVFFSHFRDSNLMGAGNILDASSAFVTALLPMLRAKVSAVLTQVSDQPQHLSHLIHELMNFDSTLRDEWHYDGAFGIADSTWGGLCWEALTSQGWFDHWLRVEQNFALARYQTIVDDSSALTIDYDSLSSTATKPTSAAIRVHDLVVTITSTYKPLTSLSQKLRFLMDIQITILDRFHDRLRSALQAFESKTSTVGRTVQGVSAAELADLQGVSGLDRLCRIFGSADYLEQAMRDWSDDIFFLDLWNQLQVRVQNNERGEPLTGPLGLADIAAKTSASLTEGDDTEDSAAGALFDETASSYAALRDRAEGLIVTTMRRGLTESMNPYMRNAEFASSPSGGSSQSELTPSSTLAATLSSLQASLNFLAGALSPQALRRVSRAVRRIADELMFERVILTKDFSENGAKQLASDLSALSGVFERFTMHGMGMAGLRKSSEAATLLGLDGNEENAGGADATDGKATLWAVERRIFASNEDARAALAELDLSILTENEARKVMKCRLELSG